MATLEKLLASSLSCSYLDLTPSKLEQLYDNSALFLSRRQRLLGSEDLYQLLHQHFYLSLLTSNDQEAQVVLQRIVDKFGEETPRVGLLKAQYIEATDGIKASQAYLSSKKPHDFMAFKRKVTVLKQNGNLKLYIEELLRYLNVCPNDAETWAEVAEAYYESGL